MRGVSVRRRARAITRSEKQRRRVQNRELEQTQTAICEAVLQLLAADADLTKYVKQNSLSDAASCLDTRLQY